jgi:DMSO/TMAO reductase YedYZ molybdopterin-dependent catalytic subunit
MTHLDYFVLTAQPARSRSIISGPRYFIDGDMTTLMHPQVVLAWQLDDEPIPPQHSAPLRLIIPFRYGGRSLKAITEIQFTATSFAPPKPWPT